MVPDVLGGSPHPLAFPTIAPSGVGDPAGHDSVLRTWVRSLSMMQKEGVVARNGSPNVWRLSSDEGPYLGGHDAAPAPLAVTTAGFAADVLDHLGDRVRATDQLVLAVDTFFRIEGSMIRSTMVGLALEPNFTVRAPGIDQSELHHAMMSAVSASATVGLLGPRLTSTFRLFNHGRRLDVGRVSPMPEVRPDPVVPVGSPVPVREVGELLTKLRDADDKPPDAGVGLEESQDRPLHIRAEGRFRADGLQQIDVEVIRPHGSVFRMLSDRSGERAPDALTLVSAGLGFCLMTQIGRFAKIARQDLGRYAIVQDTRFSTGDPHLERPIGGRAGAAETNVYLESDGDDDFARRALDMSEQTCFLHALCRTELRPRVPVRVDEGVVRHH